MQNRNFVPEFRNKNQFLEEKVNDATSIISQKDEGAATLIYSETQFLVPKKVFKELSDQDI